MSKAISVMLFSALFLSGCGRQEQAPAPPKPEQQKAEHPKAEHPKAEHPKQKSEHPDHPK
jgi:PBP1b-binding outer membrane lipoprotein LpoB